MTTHPVEDLRRVALAATGSESLDNPAVAAALDAADELRSYRDQFHFPNRRAIPTHGTTPSSGAAAPPTENDAFLYFVGNSLGLQHKGVEASVVAELQKWRDQACEGHFEQPNPWFEIDDILRADMAAIVGALPSEVVVMNSLTVNLHLLLCAMYRPNGRKRKILCERFPFPSDTHAFISQLAFHGLTVADLIEVTASDAATGGASDQEQCVEIPTARFIEAIEANKDDIAVIVVGGVHFLTGQFFDIEAITRCAHAHGILVGVDAAHAAGNIPLQLHDWGVDFACWCTYKYLNGGPGNIAGAFVHERHHPVEATAQATQPPAPLGGAAAPLLHGQLKGWWGHQRKNRFSLHKTFETAPGAASLQLSNPPVVCLMSLAPSVRLFASIGMPKLRKKSEALTAYLEALLDERFSKSFIVVTPRDPRRRGCQLSLRIVPGAVPESLKAGHAAYENGTDLGNDADLLQRLLRERGVQCDCRPPDIVRIAPVPIYNSFTDVWKLVNILKSIFFPTAPAA